MLLNVLASQLYIKWHMATFHELMPNWMETVRSGLTILTITKHWNMTALLFIAEWPDAASFRCVLSRSMFPTVSSSSWRPCRPTTVCSVWRPSWRSWPPNTGPPDREKPTALRLLPRGVQTRNPAPWRWDESVWSTSVRYLRRSIFIWLQVHLNKLEWCGKVHSFQ